MEDHLPLIQVLLHLESLPIPAGYSLGKLSFSLTKLDTPLSQLSFGCGKQCYLYSNVLYKGEICGGGFNARSCYFSTL